MRAASVVPCTLVLGLALAGCRIEHAASGRPTGVRSAADSITRALDDSAASDAPRRALRAFYQRLSRRDWAQVTDAFWRGAVVTGRFVPAGSRDPRLSVSSVDEFVRLSRQVEGRKAVYAIDPVSMDVHAYGDVAEGWVVFRARSGTKRDAVTTSYGVDAFHLIRHEGVWRITSLTWTVEDPDRPLAPATAPPTRAAAAAAGAPGAPRR